MNLLGLDAIGGIVKTVGDIAGDLITTDKERMQLELDGYRAESERMAGQVEVNKIEAGNASLFVAGWRPAVGWVGVAAMAYQFLAYPFLQWGWAALQASGMVHATMMPPPPLDTDALWVILSGILGLGVYRTAEKVKGVTRCMPGAGGGCSTPRAHSTPTWRGLGAGSGRRRLLKALGG